MNSRIWYVMRYVDDDAHWVTHRTRKAQYMDKHGRWVDDIRNAEIFDNRADAEYVCVAYTDEGAILGYMFL